MSFDFWNAPEKIWREIVKNLNAKDCCSLTLVNKELHDRIENDLILWKGFFEAEFRQSKLISSLKDQSASGIRKSYLKRHNLRVHMSKVTKNLGGLEEGRNGIVFWEKSLNVAVEFNFEDVVQYCFVKMFKQCAADSAELKRIASDVLFKCSEIGRPAIANRLLTMFPIASSFRNANGESLLHVASSRDLAMMFLRCGCSPKLYSNKGEMPIHTAARLGYLDVVKSMLDGSSINWTTKNGDTPLSVACTAGTINVVKSLLAIGADVRCKNLQERTPLHCAALANQKEAVMLLLAKKSCHPNIVDINGNTPLDLSAVANNLEIIELLLQVENKVIEPDVIRSLSKTHIGMGAFGDVFKATMNGRQVAMKHLRTNAMREAGRDMEWIKKKFLVEVAMLNKLGGNSHFVLLVGASFSHPDDFWIVSEFIPGGSIYDLIHGITIHNPTPFVNKLVEQIVDAMIFLHTRIPQIIHRDLTSSNILLDGAANIKITDFGISRFKELSGDQTMSYIGNPRWRAPEVTRNEKYSAKVDVYAFGLIVWEMLTGYIPFHDLQASVACMRAAQGQRPPIPEDVPDEWQDLVRACWNHDPTARPLFREIKPFLQALPKIPIHFGPALMAGSDTNSY